ncbi:DMT family transporter [Ottowia sp.]|uniref:DMT family transporter n=1 Tax=Ottowia sp. TaxID=1898956 RepID=UPI002C3B187F|nr:DMT family transporter [Ottowia sp.]HOB66921.1 DMT family transporter [Ottowia sp.]HPZ57110.1 DMT family transporter [Ottowia sp.]HQD47945.1 DMT family transporter [Ottowia sp.]
MSSYQSHSDHASTWPVLALVFNALVWGLSWIAFKALHAQGLHPLWSTAIVYAGALAALLAWRPGSVRALLRHPWLLGLAAAAGLTNVGFNWAVTVGDVVRVTLLFYLMPVWSIGLAWWLLHERPTRGALLRLLLALGGLVLVLHKPGSPWPLPRGAADLLALLGGFCFALTNALLRRWRATPPDARVLAMFGGGWAMSMALALAGLAGGPPGAAWLAGAAGWLPWAVGLTLAFLCGNLALQYGAARLPAQVTALIMLAEVVFASASAVWLGAATPTAWTWAGGALILLAALLSIRPVRGAG